MTQDNYAGIVRNNLEKLFSNLPVDFAARLPCKIHGKTFAFPAFGEICQISPSGILLGGKEAPSIVGILISLYALAAKTDLPLDEPYRAFKEMPGSTPYVGAFSSHAEEILIPHVSRIKKMQETIQREFNQGRYGKNSFAGDFSLQLFPLPKISLFYIFYEADEDFPPSATCLFSNNADLFLPVDGLADTGEYTSRKIVELIEDQLST